MKRHADPVVDTIPLQRGVLYGPVQSRRLGRSLGINLLPPEIKVCSFDCRYCQYAWTGMQTLDPKLFRAFVPTRAEVAQALRHRLTELRTAGKPPENITFSGNGEATLHPEFSEIARDVVALRDELAPACRTAILSNSTTLLDEAVREAIQLLDDPILKLDCGREETFHKLNRPAKGISFEGVLQGLRLVGPSIILQAMFVQGTVDNSMDEEVRAWANQVRHIAPRGVQMYSLDRGPADRGLLPVPAQRLHEIASLLKAIAGIDAQVTA
jgi:wyosine [tRNA(Phe)-imidazoG37] synthetase (radical SAM superfamily)